jgi:hypothetical protein
MCLTDLKLIVKALIDVAVTASAGLNYFVNFYCMQWFWKKAGFKSKEQLQSAGLKISDGSFMEYSNTNGFYAIFLPNKTSPKPNKSLFDRILKQQANTSTLKQYAGHLAELTGVPIRYYDGSDYFRIPGLGYEDWYKLGDLRKKRKYTQKKSEQINLEEKINRALESAYAGFQNGAADLRAIIFYIKTLKKWVDDSAQNKQQQILSLINQFTKRDMELITDLQHYSDVLKEHLDRVNSVICLSKFKD